VLNKQIQTKFISVVEMFDVFLKREMKRSLKKPFFFLTNAERGIILKEEKNN